MSFTTPEMRPDWRTRFARVTKPIASDATIVDILLYAIGHCAGPTLIDCVRVAIGLDPIIHRRTPK